MIPITRVHQRHVSAKVELSEAAAMDGLRGFGIAMPSA